MSIGLDDLQRCVDSSFRKYWKEKCGEIAYDPTSQVDQSISVSFASGFVAGFALALEVGEG
jgi:hypothetical protein